MRVAQRMISRNYKRQINSSMKKQNDALERSESGLAFKRLSENVSSGSRAMHLQEQRYAAQQQLDNVKNLMAEQKSIDSNLSSMHSILQKIQESVLTGMSEDWGVTSREVLAQQISQQMEQLLQFANAQFGGHTLFGGTNNSVPPFTVSEQGKLQFNGIDVDQIFKSAKDGKYYYYKPELDANGNEKFTIEGLTPPDVSFDGESFLTGGIQNGLKSMVIDGVTYYNDGTSDIYTSIDGKTFEANNTGGYDTVVIDGLTYVNDGTGIYYREGFQPGTEFERVFQSTDGGLTFVEMERVNMDPDDHNNFVLQPMAGGLTKTFEAPDPQDVPLAFKTNSRGGYDQVVINNKNYVRAGTDENGNMIYKSLDPSDPSIYTSTDGLNFRPTVDESGNDVVGGALTTFEPPEMVGTLTEVPNSGATFADIGLGLKIKSSDMMADPRTAYQVSFSGLDILGCAGISYDDPPTHPGTIYGSKNGTPVSGNLYDLLGQIQNALDPNFDKAALDDLFTQLVDLTDNLGMVRTDLGNRMQYLELTETRLDDDIYNMTELESDLISSDPAMEAIKMKECEYVWLALMQLGSKVLPASLLDFMS